ncbi:MAG: HAMP domain-containing histidine kinase [Patescibacteria group bacterium]|nr:HAMP domain-containing histidine kinase [Patescibacteria group bacterium]
MYEQYHKIFRLVVPILILILLVWFYFFPPKESLWFLSIIVAMTFYSFISLFFISKRYWRYEKFFIDLGFYTLFILLFIHFSGSFQSPLFPFIFLPLLAAASTAHIPALIGLLIIIVFYYLLMFGLSIWLKISFFLDFVFLSLSSVAIISYLSFLLALQAKKEIDFLKELDEKKSEFITIASHQLRGPISSIGWITDELLENKKVDVEKREYLEEIKRAQIKMMKSVNDLLAITDLDGKPIKTRSQETDLNLFLEEKIKQFNFLIEGKGLKIIFEKQFLPKVFLDQKFLEIIFNNILSNAINYSRPGGKIKITAGKTDTEIIISIKDEGIGIPKDKQKDIFQKFFRAPNALRYQPDGTGLGLYIVKKLIDDLKGKIWFESEENKGSTFYFTLPYEKTKLKDQIDTNK